MKKYVEADSGYRNAEFFNACQVKDVNFVVSMRANMFQLLLKYLHRWKDVKNNEKMK